MAAEAKLVLKNSWKAFGGLVKKYTHASVSTKTEMTFSIFLPSVAEKAKVPTVYWLSGLTCTDDNFMHKAGALRTAERLGLAVICPDTSPRGTNIPTEHDNWDFGSGAGFYVNATEPNWKENYNMYDYVTKELPSLVSKEFNVTEAKSVFGHSMGGHGALICFLKNPGLYASVSAFAPICHPIGCPWGEKAFSGYLGADRNAWKAWDASELLRNYKGPAPSQGILVDQGDKDNFLEQKQLLPEALAESGKAAGVEVNVRMQPGYDHSYYFISSFVDEHLEHHARALGKLSQ